MAEIQAPTMVSALMTSAFVGRGDELAAVHHHVERVHHGESGFLVVEAEAGGGKSSLIRHALATSDRISDFTIFASEGDPNDPRAFRCLSDALGCRLTSPDPAKVRIAELLRSSPVERRDGVSAAIQELIVDVVERAALEQPVMLVLDDLHWADDSTLGAIGSLTRRLRGLSVGVLCASRHSQRVQAAIEPFHPTVLRLRPLTDADLATLASTVTGVAPSARDLEALSSVRSNPFLVAMLAAVDSQRAAGPGTDREALSREAFRRLVASLEPTLRSFLELAAVAGREIDVDVLAEASGERVATAVTMTREAVARGWLEADADSVRFRHDLLSEALVTSLPPDRRDRLHLRLGRALAELGHAPGRAGFHLDAASYLVSTKDLPKLLTVLDGLSVDDDLAWAIAKRAYELDASDPRISLALMRCLASRHRHTEAVAVARPWLETNESRDIDVVGRIRLAAASSLVATDGSDRAIHVLRQGLESSGLSDALRADYLNAIARLHWYQRDALAVQTAASEALEASRRAASHHGEVHALCSLSEAAALLGDVEKALHNAESAMRLSGRLRGRAPASPELALGTALAISGRMTEGLPILTRSLHEAERAGDPAAMALAQVTMHGTRFHIGDWDGYEADADAMMQIGDETGIRNGIVLPLGFAALVATRRGNFSDVPRVLARLRAESTRGDAHPAAILGVLLGELAETEASGRLEEACTKTADFVDLLASAGYSAQGLISMDAVRLAWTVGNQTVLDSMAEFSVDAAERADTETRRALAAVCAALARHDVPAIMAAAQVLATTERAWDGATALHMAGLAAKEAKLGDAKSLLGEAARRYRGLGAMRHAAAARAGQGFRHLHDALTTAPAAAVSQNESTLEQLSAAERRVLDLVALGRANGDIASELFVSKRTVESHIAALYRKLNVTTRVALARAGTSVSESPRGSGARRAEFARSSAKAAGQ